jgi:hypothetical protein
VEEGSLSLSGHHIRETGTDTVNLFQVTDINIALSGFGNQSITFGVFSDKSVRIKGQILVSRRQVKQNICRTAAGGTDDIDDIAKISYAGPAVKRFDFIIDPVSGTDNTVSHKHTSNVSICLIKKYTRYIRYCCNCKNQLFFRFFDALASKILTEKLKKASRQQRKSIKTANSD